MRVFVTGASRGIGRGLALALAQRGDAVVLGARSAAPLQSVAERCRSYGAEAVAVPLDLADADSVRAACAEALEGGPIDALVNNAALYEQKTVLEQDADAVEREVQVNYLGPQRMVRGLLPSMLERGRGTIVNVSSLLGTVASPTTANYCGTKAGLEAWSHALRGEVEHRGVKVVVYVPPHTDNEGGRSMRFDGVTMLSEDYAVRGAVRAIDRAPRVAAASPVYGVLLRLGAWMPRLMEANLRRSTRALLPG